MTPGEYLVDNAAPHAASRFDALAGLFDPVTTRHLGALGVGPGWRCWEVGAGGPSLPGWLAGQVGPSGRVLATDIDVSWLAGDRPFEVLRHDVAVDDPPAGGFDLVHARLVLTHVPSRERALRMMAAALAPGGVLLVEDFDMRLQPLACLDGSAGFERRANRIRDGFSALLEQRGVDGEFGRSLPRRLRALGLVDVGADAWSPLVHPAVAELEAANVEQVRSALVARGAATDADLDAHVAAARRGDVDLTTPPLVSAWGRRPDAA